MNDGFYHTIPYEFAHHALPALVQGQDRWVEDNDSEEVQNRLPDLISTAPQTLKHALEFYQEFNLREVTSSTFRRHEKMALFFQQWSPETIWDKRATQTLIERDDHVLVLPEEIEEAAEVGIWNGIKDWIEPYQAKGKCIKIGNNGPVHLRSTVLELATEKKVPLSFLTRKFWCRLSDGGVHSIDLLFLHRNWNKLGKDFDSNAAATFGTADHPIVIDASPQLHKDLEEFTRDPELTTTQDTQLWRIQIKYSIGQLLKMKEFFAYSNGSDSIEALNIQIFLSKTSQAIVAMDWSDPNVWNEVHKQLKEVPQAEIFELEPNKELHWRRHHIEAFIDHGLITQEDLTSQQTALLKAYIRPFSEDEMRAHHTSILPIIDIISSMWSGIKESDLERTAMNAVLYGTLSLKKLYAKKLGQVRWTEWCAEIGAETVFTRSNGNAYSEANSIQQISDNKVEIVISSKDLPKRANGSFARSLRSKRVLIAIGFIASAAMALLVIWRANGIFAANRGVNASLQTRLSRIWSFLFRSPVADTAQRILFRT